MATYYLLQRCFDIGNKVPKNQDFGKRLINKIKESSGWMQTTLNR